MYMSGKLINIEPIVFIYPCCTMCVCVCVCVYSNFYPSIPQPFWPTGTGCARGFLGAFDAAWMLKRLCVGVSPLELLEEREAIYYLLPQTTPERLQKNFTGVCVCVCVRERERVCVCVRERERVCACVHV